MVASSPAEASSVRLPGVGTAASPLAPPKSAAVQRRLLPELSISSATATPTVKPRSTVRAGLGLRDQRDGHDQLGGGGLGQHGVEFHADEIARAEEATAVE